MGMRTARMLARKTVHQRTGLSQKRFLPTPVALGKLFLSLLIKKMEEEVTSYERTCQPKGIPVCTKKNERECITIEWEECKDEIVETCKTLTLNNPYQTFHHILRCSIEHNLENQSDQEFDEIYDDGFHLSTHRIKSLILSGKFTLFDMLREF